MKKIAIIAVLAALVSCSYESVSRRLVTLGNCSSELELGESRRVHIKTNVGDLTVRSEEGDRIRIEAAIKVEERRLAEFKTADFQRDVRVSRKGDELLIENAHLDAADRDDWGVGFTVTLPPMKSLAGETGVGNIAVQMDVEQLDVKSGVGDVELSGSILRVTAKSGTGNVELDAPALGSADLSSGTGDVSLEVMQGPTDNTTVKTGVGNVSCFVSADYDGKVDLRTSVGNVTFANAPGVQSKKSVVGGSASGALGQGRQVLRGATGTGDVSFHRFEDRSPLQVEKMN